ncbi:pilus assembly protein N-terminal domain-containing protein [Candidatus Liberibacter asiaticus]|uniref:pilus assembly protein N-terminal domain-containing protein n=1 Tax=Liberibacter asiaticus TaxID=34021 RepID=UPI0001835427|nr:pilus assembly protein N-terminal domain-containing protein [Candidatus Liberibacter asiaticus]
MKFKKKKPLPPLPPLHRKRQREIKNETVRKKGIPTTASQKTPEDNSNRIRIAVGQSLILQFDVLPKQVIVGDDKIVDVLALEKEKTVVITGKNLGSTNIIVLGHNNDILLDTEIATFANEQSTVRVYTPGTLSFLSCTPRCLPSSPPVR